MIHRRVSPDFPKVFRWRGMKGETPEELSEILKRGEVLVSDNLLHFSTDNPRPMTEYVGRRIVLDMDTANPVRVGASIVPVRYNDYMQGQINRTVVTGIPRSYFNVGVNSPSGSRGIWMRDSSSRSWPTPIRSYARATSSSPM